MSAVTEKGPIAVTEKGLLGQVWYLIVSIPDLCTLIYSCFCSKGLFIHINHSEINDLNQPCHEIPRQAIIIIDHGLRTNEQNALALAGLYGWAGSPEPLMVVSRGSDQNIR